jgi:hypothetical protein
MSFNRNIFPHIIMNLVDLKGDVALGKPLLFAATQICLVIRSMYRLVLPVNILWNETLPAIYFICHIQFDH